MQELRQLVQKICEGELNQFYRASPIGNRNYKNYNGALSEDLFFRERIYVDADKTGDYNDIVTAFKKNQRPIILIYGTRGCGKSTLLCDLRRNHFSNHHGKFELLNFDENTGSNVMPRPTEKFCALLMKRFKQDWKDNDCILIRRLLQFYKVFEDEIDEAIGAEQTLLVDFFQCVETTYKDKKPDKGAHNDSKKELKKLPLRVLLMLLFFWDLCEMTHAKNGQYQRVYAMDNIDGTAPRVQVMEFYTNLFDAFKDGENLVNALLEDWRGIDFGFEGISLAFNQIFKLIICARDTTWAKVSNYKREGDLNVNAHAPSYINDSVFSCNITQLYNMQDVALTRHNWLKLKIPNDAKHFHYSCLFVDILNIMEQTRRSSIFTMFNNDYRTCIDAIHEVVFGNKASSTSLIRDEFSIVANAGCMYGARGMILKGIFELFQHKKYFKDFGLCNLVQDSNVCSIGRQALVCLSSQTNPRNDETALVVSELIESFQNYLSPRPASPTNIVSEDEICHALRKMYLLKDGDWGHLINVTCETQDDVDNIGKKIPLTATAQITEAGIEFLDLIATHFEFFSCRVTKDRSKSHHKPLFSKVHFDKQNDRYLFEKVVNDVLAAVENCCAKLNEFIRNYGIPLHGGDLERYVDESMFVYEAWLYESDRRGNRATIARKRGKVLHGERLIHTHCMYLEDYIAYAEATAPEAVTTIKDYIGKYLDLTAKYPFICSKPNIIDDIGKRTLGENDWRVRKESWSTKEQQSS